MKPNAKTTHCDELKIVIYYIQNHTMRGIAMTENNIITILRKQVGMTRKAFSEHTGIPVRTLEDWEAGRRTPPEYIPRLIEYQLKYEELIRKQGGDSDETK